MLFVWHPKILNKNCFQFLLGVIIGLIETENNAYAKFWRDKQGALWYVIVFSGVVNHKFGNKCRDKVLKIIGVVAPVKLSILDKEWLKIIHQKGV